MESTRGQVTSISAGHHCSSGEKTRSTCHRYFPTPPNDLDSSIDLTEKSITVPLKHRNKFGMELQFKMLQVLMIASGKNSDHSQWRQQFIKKMLLCKHHSICTAIINNPFLNTFISYYHQLQLVAIMQHFPEIFESVKYHIMTTRWS